MNMNPCCNLAHIRAKWPLLYREVPIIQVREKCTPWEVNRCATLVTMLAHKVEKFLFSLQLNFLHAIGEAFVFYDDLEIDNKIHKHQLPTQYPDDLKEIIWKVMWHQVIRLYPIPPHRKVTFISWFPGYASIQ